MNGVGLIIPIHGNALLKRNTNVIHKTIYMLLLTSLLEHLIFIVGTRIRIF
jgi:hypothetical protein